MENPVITMEKPAKVFSAGLVSASIFMNERKVKGEDKTIPSISFQKRYQEEGKWKSTGNLNLADLPRAVLVLTKAYEYLASRHEPDDDLLDLA